MSEPLLKNVSMREVRQRLWWTRHESGARDDDRRTLLLYFQDLRVACLVKQCDSLWEMLAEIVHAPTLSAQSNAVDIAWKYLHEGEYSEQE